MPHIPLPWRLMTSSTHKQCVRVFLQLGDWVADHAIEGDGIYAAARELLLRRVRRLKESTLADFGNGGTGVSPVSHAQDARATSRLLDFEHLRSLEAAKKIAPVLDRTVLPIQGPPGSCKTFTGAH